MSSLVSELQQEALNPSTNLTDLLRKALVVARKLGIKDFQIWIENELKGYKDNTIIPDYRKIICIPQARGKYSGWSAIRFSDKENEEYWSTRHCNEPISHIMSIVNQKSGSDTIQLSYTAESSKLLMDTLSNSAQAVRSIVGISSLEPILDIVRTIILNWSMKLEEDNILGEGMTFSNQEKEIAKSPIYNNINNFYGDVSSSQIQQQTSDSKQSITTIESIDIKPILEFIKELREKISELKLTSDKENELNSDLNTIDAQASSPKPKIPIIRECFSSIRRILEGAGGAIIAAELIMKLNSIPM